MRYRKIATIEAVQFDGSVPYPEGVIGRYVDPGGTIHDGVENDPRMVPGIDYRVIIDTLEGEHAVEKGDWIATGVNGEHWPIKPDVFAKSYIPENAAARGAGTRALKGRLNLGLLFGCSLVLEADGEIPEHIAKAAKDWCERHAELDRGKGLPTADDFIRGLSRGIVDEAGEK